MDRWSNHRGVELGIISVKLNGVFLAVPCLGRQGRSRGTFHNHLPEAYGETRTVSWVQYLTVSQSVS